MRSHAVHSPRQPSIRWPLAVALAGLLLAAAGTGLAVRAQQRMDSCFAAIVYATQAQDPVGDFGVEAFCK